MVAIKTKKLMRRRKIAAQAIQKNKTKNGFDNKEQKDMLMN